MMTSQQIAARVEDGSFRVVEWTDLSKTTAEASRALCQNDFLEFDEIELKDQSLDESDMHWRK